MSEKNFPLNKEQLEQLTQGYETPFYLYDEKAIRENMRGLPRPSVFFLLLRNTLR